MMLLYILIQLLLALNSLGAELERRHGAMRHAHHHHGRRGDPAPVAEIETAEVIIYENAQGSAIATSTSILPPQLAFSPVSDTPASISLASSKPATSAQQQPSAPAPAPQPATPSSASGEASDNVGAAHVGPGFKFGAVYNAKLADASCRSAPQVQQDVDLIIQKGHDLIRLYDTGYGCNQVANVFAAIKGKPVSMFLGLPNLDTLSADLKDLVGQLNHDFSHVNTIAIGNELVNSKTNSTAEVVAAMNSARSQLKAVGYTGPVVTVDTMVAIQSNPTLCTASDYCAMNCHGYFDGNVQGSGAGGFVKMFEGLVSKATGGKQIVVTETGWPHCGATNGKAVANLDQQSAAIQSLKSAFSSNLIIMSPFNEYWKGDNQWDVERCWGIYGDSPSGR